MSTNGIWEPGDVLEGQTLVLELIARGESLRQVLDTLLRVIQLQSSGMLASILLLDPDGIHVRHGAAPDLPEDYVRAVDGLAIGPQAGSCGTAAFTRKAVVVGDIATDPLWNDYRAMALKHDLRTCWYAQEPTSKSAGCQCCCRHPATARCSSASPDTSWLPIS